MQATGGFPVDLVLFAMIAAFLVLRLRSILGKRTGFEGAPAIPPGGAARAGAPILDAKADPIPSGRRPLPDPAGPVGRTMASMRGIDHRFDPEQFLAGAEHAFRMIVGAFAAGDRERLRPLLAPETFAAFERAITAREAAGHTQRTDISAIEEVTITDAAVTGTRASLTVRFVSRQVNLTLDAAGNPVNGTDGITEMSDVWTFERDLAQADLTWRLTAARSA